MAVRAREQLRTGTPSRDQSQRRAVRAPLPPVAAGVLELQRSAGNRAVSAVIARQVVGAGDTDVTYLHEDNRAELVNYWRKELTDLDTSDKSEDDKGKLRSRYGRYIGNLESGARPEPAQSEAEVKYLFNDFGPRPQVGYKHGSQSSRKGSTRPDLVLTTALVEVKNYRLTPKGVTDMLGTLRRQIEARREHGPYNVKQQAVIVDARGQVLVPGQVALLKERIVTTTAIPVANIEVLAWTPRPAAPAHAGSALPDFRPHLRPDKLSPHSARLVRAMGSRAATGVAGAAAQVLASVVEDLAWRKLLERRRREEEEKAAAALSAKFPEGVALALRHPEATVYGIAVYRFSSVQARLGDASGSTVRNIACYYDTTPVQGLVLKGEDIGVLASEEWETHATSVPLSAMLESAPAEMQESFAQARQEALAERRQAHPEEAPLSSVRSVPSEPPLAR